MRRIVRDRSDNSADTQTFMTGLLCGVAFGAAAGLLFAPRAGSELRGKLYESAGEVRQRASAVYRRTRNRADEAYGQASDTARDLVDRGRAAVDVARGKAGDVEATLRDRIGV